MTSLRAAQARRRKALAILNNPANLADARGGDRESARLVSRAREDIAAADAVIAEHTEVGISTMTRGVA